MFNEISSTILAQAPTHRANPAAISGPKTFLCTISVTPAALGHPRQKLCALRHSSRIRPSVRGEKIPVSEFQTGRARMIFEPSSQNELAFLAPCPVAGVRVEEIPVSVGGHSGAEGKRA